MYSWFSGTRVRVRGPGHRFIRKGALLYRTEIEIIGSNCRVEFAPGVRLWNCSITVFGDGATLLVGAGCQLRQARLVVEDDGSRMIIGSKTTMIGPTAVAQEGHLVQIGEDCMIAQYADIRNSDSHSILEEATGQRINPARDIVLDDRVWLGIGAIVFKGSRIGSNSIIGARSMVIGDIPPNCIAIGTPAKPWKNGIKWDRVRLKMEAGMTSAASDLKHAPDAQRERR
jgi:carbonic anhydrase/acetyltransferase-like protein (isoleucine patch superfamily)